MINNEKLSLILAIGDEENPNQIWSSLIMGLVITLSMFFLILEEVIVDSKYTIYISQINFFLQIFFIIEYLIRFYTASNFYKDLSEKNILYALKIKLIWIFKIRNLIDLLAIIPTVRFLRIFKAFRYFKLLRFFRVFRFVKVIRNMNKTLIILRGLKSSFRYILGTTLICIVLLILFSIGMFLIESKSNNPNLDTVTESFFYSLKILNYVDLTPKSIFGKVLSSFLLFSNIAFFSVLVSIFSTKMEDVMSKMKEGNLGKLSLKNHILLCGYTRTTEIVIEQLKKDIRCIGQNIVLITNKDNIDIDGVLYLKGDFSDYKVLDNACVKHAKVAVIFGEKFEGDLNERMTDLRTFMTTFHIEKNYSEVHTISEIYCEENAELIQEKINGDEVIFKERVDASLIFNSIVHNNVSPMIYELLDLDGKVMRSKKLKTLFKEEMIKYKEIKLLSIDFDINIFGILESSKLSEIEMTEAKRKEFTKLAPLNDEYFSCEDTLIYISEREI